MRRGFKTEAEGISERVRAEMGKRAGDGIDADAVARHIGAAVVSAADLVGIERLKALDVLQPGAFSAATFIINGQHVIVFNPLASGGRTQSDIAHEVAHILLKHALNTAQEIGGLTFFTCDPDEEQEANWLAGCLLLPRPLLYAAVQRGLTAEDLSRKHGVSRQMAEFRLRATGVLRQLVQSS